MLAIADWCNERGTMLEDNVLVDDMHPVAELKEYTTGYFENTQMSAS